MTARLHRFRKRAHNDMGHRKAEPLSARNQRRIDRKKVAKQSLLKAAAELFKP